MIFRLAWRNLWRNKRRSLITMFSVFLAVILSTLMSSLKEGVYDNMIRSMVGTFTGYAQIHATGYWDEKSLDNSMTLNDTLLSKLETAKEVAGFLPRIETGGLVASDSVTKFSLLVGIDPQKEAENSALPERISEGTYLQANERAVIVGAGLAEYLKVSAGDTIVLLGQGYHGANAAGKYPVKGIIHFGSPELSKQLVILPLKEAQWLFNMEDRYTGLILRLNDPDEAQTISRNLASGLPPYLEVMSWQEMNPVMVRMIETDTIEGYIFMAILYMVISFGLFGTMLMMLAERRHEFGVLTAIGMQRIKLAVMVWMELCLLSLLGAILGIAGAIPVCLYFHYNPISLGEEMKDMVEEYGMEAVMQASLDPVIFLQQACIVFILASGVALYPLVKLNRLNAIKSMRA